MIVYQALFEPDKEAGGFVVTFPDFGYGATQGDDLAEAMEMAVDLLRCTISDFMEADKDIPKPSHRRGKHYRMVSLPALHSAKIELYRAFRSSGLRKADLARKTGIAEANINRLFDLDHNSRLDQLEIAFRALGKTLIVEAQDAA